MKTVVVGLIALVLHVGVGAPAMAAGSEGNTCRKLPSGKRVVKLTLKPDTEIADLIAWISTITCAQFFVPGSIDVHAKKVTIVAPELITKEEAFRLFLTALDSVDLMVIRAGRFWRVMETAHAKSSAIPYYDGDGKGRR